MSEKKKKEKKEKVIYIDDGRTIADMSNVGYGYSSKNGRPHATMKEKMRTFWEAFKMMLVPTLIISGVLVATYFLMYFALS